MRTVYLRRRAGLATAALLLFCACGSTEDPATSVPAPQSSWGPERYVCPRVDAAPRIDGRLDEDAWQAAPWTADFVDIQGAALHRPRLRTRAKMLWDERYFYVGAELEEPHVWGTLNERDSVIFHDNDFELFIDPDGDTHQYFELEINALGTEWDLRLTKPYRDDGQAIDAWDIEGLRAAIYVDGSLNDPRDLDRGWSVELAIPWESLQPFAGMPTPPRPGDIWRVNFSRVQWQLDVVGSDYVKRKDPTTGEPFPEDNWVWSPQGLINMHYPEKWGFVIFSDGPGEDATLQ